MTTLGRGKVEKVITWTSNDIVHVYSSVATGCTLVHPDGRREEIGTFEQGVPDALRSVFETHAVQAEMKDKIVELTFPEGYKNKDITIGCFSIENNGNKFAVLSQSYEHDGHILGGVGPVGEPTLTIFLRNPPQA